MTQQIVQLNAENIAELIADVRLYNGWEMVIGEDGANYLVMKHPAKHDVYFTPVVSINENVIKFGFHLYNLNNDDEEIEYFYSSFDKMLSKLKFEIDEVQIIRE